MESLFGQAPLEEENEWISFSDLMAVMMVIFVFIAIIYFDRVPKNQKQIIEQKVQLQKDIEILESESLRLEALQKKLENDLITTLARKSEIEAESKDLKIKTEDAQRNMKEALIAVARAEEAKNDFTSTIKNFRNIEKEIYFALIKEFEDDLPIWNAEIVRENLIFRFKSPEVLFPVGKSELSARFRKILSAFVPRYVKVLREFDEYIDEIRVEGHTSSEFSSEPDALGKYIANMNLSQDRTRSVTAFSLKSIPDDKRQWLQNLLTANGLSSSKLIRTNGAEDRKKSRRVEFTIRTAIRKTFVQLEEISQ